MNSTSVLVLGIIALALGVLTLMFAWIPIIGMLAIPFAAMGVIVGIIGIALGARGGDGRLWMSLVGAILCGLSVGVSYLSTVMWQNRDTNPSAVKMPPQPPPVDMRNVKGPFVPTPPQVRQEFKMPDLPKPPPRDDAPVEKP